MTLLTAKAMGAAEVAITGMIHMETLPHTKFNIPNLLTKDDEAVNDA